MRIWSCYFRDGKTPQSLAKRYGVSTPTIYAITERRTHKGTTATLSSIRRFQKMHRPNAKLKKSQVLNIWSKYAAGGVSMRRLAEKHGVTFSAVHGILKRRTWVEYTAHLSDFVMPARTAKLGGKRRPYVKLTPDAVRLIRQKLSDGVSGAKLSRETGASTGNIAMIKKRQTWKHV